MYLSTLNDVKGKDFEVLGIVRTFIAANNYFYNNNGDNTPNAIDAALDDLESQADDMGADAVIGITIVSASTYCIDDDDNEFPDIIAYGTAIKFK